MKKEIYILSVSPNMPAQVKATEVSLPTSLANKPLPVRRVGSVSLMQIFVGVYGIYAVGKHLERRDSQFIRHSFTKNEDLYGRSHLCIKMMGF